MSQPRLNRTRSYAKESLYHSSLNRTYATHWEDKKKAGGRAEMKLKKPINLNRDQSSKSLSLNLETDIDLARWPDI